MTNKQRKTKGDSWPSWKMKSCHTELTQLVSLSSQRLCVFMSETQHRLELMGGWPHHVFNNHRWRTPLNWAWKQFISEPLITERSEAWTLNLRCVTAVVQFDQIISASELQFFKRFRAIMLLPNCHDSNSQLLPHQNCFRSWNENLTMLWTFWTHDDHCELS